MSGEEVEHPGHGRTVKGVRASHHVRHPRATPTCCVKRFGTILAYITACKTRHSKARPMQSDDCPERYASCIKLVLAACGSHFKEMQGTLRS